MKIIQSFNHSIRFNYLRILKVAFFATFILFVTSCRLDEDIKPEAGAPINTEGQTKLGKKLENPYTVENMRKAQENLRSRGQSSEFNVRPTHLYLKFNPRDEEELDLLKSDSTLILYSYPLDQEIEEGGSYYHDPEVPAGQPTYQYVAVKVDKKLPRLDYELLAKLYIPEEDESLNGRTSGNFSVGELVDEALRITNNFTEGAHKIDKNARRDIFNPSGTIKVWDERLGKTTITEKIFDHWEYYPCEDWEISEQKSLSESKCKRPVYRNETKKIDGSYVPVVGVKVRARRWFTTHTGITNAQGVYICDGSFSRPANYSIKWERYEYEIRIGGTNAGINTIGPKKTGEWNYTIENTNLYDKFLAFIHLGAYRYYYQNILGLKRPPQNNFWKPQMKIGAYLSSGRSNYAKDLRLFGYLTPIKMYRFEESGSIRSAERIYTTMLHELAHASHWELRKGKWNKTDTKLIESWAMGVNWILTRNSRYPNHNWYEGDTFEYMKSENGGESKYTPVIIDLMDNHNQGISDITVPFDNVSDYTILQMENVLSRCNNITDLRNYLKLEYYNPKAYNLDDLIEQYKTLSR